MINSLRYTSPVIKYAYQNNEAMEEAEPTVVKKIPTVIKRRTIDYTYEQKYALGIMTEYEYMLWQQELMQKAEEERLNAEKTAVSEDEAKDLNELFESEKEFDASKKTFWEGEDGDRENISDNAYEDFLRQNGLDVSNKTATSFDDLVAQAAAEDAFKEMELMDEVARIQEKFMPTQGNIDSLFAKSEQELSVGEYEEGE